MDTDGFPFDDTQDFDDTERGFIARATTRQVTAADGRPKAWDEHLVLSFVISDLGETYVLELRNGTVNHRVTPAPAPASTTLTLARRTLIGLMTDRNFPIVTP